MNKLKILFFTFIMFFPFCVKAYGIENYYIDATVESSGDLLVQEYFNLTGDFNGFERIIEYANANVYGFDPTMASFGGSSIHNGTGLEILEIRAVPVTSSFDFSNIGGDIFEKVYSASKGDYGVYTVDDENYGNRILMYNPSSYHKAFYIKYRILNMAIRHNDVGEIGWNIVGNALTESVGNLKGYLHFPGNTNIRVWGHGPLNGSVQIMNSETVYASIQNLSSYRAIDVRATFDLDVIKDSKKETNVNALDKILLYEEDAAAKANYERENQEKMQLQDAITHVNQFEIDPTRGNYESALRYVDKLPDSDIKNEYLEKISNLKLILDGIEEAEAREELAVALEYPTYLSYKNAKEKIEILDNLDVKNELLNQLVIVENVVRESELARERINYIFGFILLAIILFIGYSIYKKYVKDPKTEFSQKYWREVPSDYSPETVSYLFHKKIKDSAMTATLLDLIHRKIIIAEKLTSKNYRLTLNESGEILVTDLESKLLDLIFNGESSIETKHMKTAAKGDYDGFIRRWNSYQRKALSNARKYMFFESDEKQKKNGKPTSFLIIFFIILAISIVPLLVIPFLLFVIVLAVVKSVSIFSSSKDKAIFGIALFACIIISIVQIILICDQKFYRQSVIIYVTTLVLSIGLMPCMFYSNKRTEKGAEDYRKWKAFRNFLNDFGRFYDKEVIEVALWEKYLVYATVFGCAKKVIEAMKVEMVNAPNDSFNIYLDLYTMNRYISRAITKSYSSAQSAYTAAHSSSSDGGFSSGSGSGGGFSSGGGSFGGGGGGGRF